MATLNTKSFDQLVQQFAAGVQARAKVLIDFSPGAILRAVGEAFSGIVLWLQSIVVQVLAVTRLATSFGSDVDSFVNDFGVFRLGGQDASGPVTFSRFTASPTSPFVPVATQVKSSDGSLIFAVTVDLTNAAYSAALGGYAMAPNVSTLTVPVAAVVAGSAGNVGVGAIGLVASPIPGIDTVTNASAFTNGFDAESDAALKARFQAYILGLSRGDAYGVEYAIQSLGVGVFYKLVDQLTYGGSAAPGFFYVVADDGSGAPPSSFLTMVTNAINAVRPLGVQFSVFAPNLVTANVGLTIATLPGFVHDTVVALVQELIEANIDGLGLGVGLDVYQIGAWALSVAGVAPSGVSGLTLNSLSGDSATLAANPNNRIMPGTISVS